MGISEFLAELIRAANLPQQLTPFEKRRLIERAVATIRDLREQLNPSGSATDDGDTLDEIAMVGRDIASIPDLLFAHALFEAVDRIRTLKIELAEAPKSGSD